MSFTVSVTSYATEDIRSIIEWIEKGSRKGAEAWFRRWLQVLDELRDAAEACGRAPEDEDHEQAIDQVLFQARRGLPYRALFVIRETRVYVLHVRGPGQDLMSSAELELPD